MTTDVVSKGAFPSSGHAISSGSLPEFFPRGRRTSDRGYGVSGPWSRVVFGPNKSPGGPDRVWSRYQAQTVGRQPGAANADASAAAREAGLRVVDDGSCLLVALATR